MPIPTTCPECLAELNIPDRLAGKTVKCLECAAHVSVPDGQKPIKAEKINRSERDEEPEPNEQPRKARRRDNDEDDYRPRKRRANSGGPSTGIIIGIVAGVLIVSGAAVGAIVIVSNRSKSQQDDSVARNALSPSGTDTTTSRPVINPLSNPFSSQTSNNSTQPSIFTPPLPGVSRPPLPPGWIDFHHPRGAFTVYLPSTPHLENASGHVSGPGMGGTGQRPPVGGIGNRPPLRPPSGGTGAGQRPPLGGMMGLAASSNSESYITLPKGDNTLVCAVIAITFPPGVVQNYVNPPPSVPNSTNLFPGITWTVTKITMGGKPAVEMVVDSDFTGMVAAFPGGEQFGQELQQQAAAGGLPIKMRQYIRHVAVNDTQLYIFQITSLKTPITDTERSAFFDSVVFGK